MGGHKEPIRLDLSKQGSRVNKTKVGPLGSKLFDSAVSVSSGSGYVLSGYIYHIF